MKTRKRSIILALLVLLLLLPQVFARTILYHGIDVSEYQGSINFNQVRNDGIEVVIIKASQGNDIIDPYFEEHAAAAAQAGMKIGYYHYLTAVNETEAIQQADFFWSLIQNHQQDCYPVMDFESFGSLTHTQINAIAIAFMTRLEELSGLTPILYSDAYNVDTLWDDTLSRYPLWIADYSVSLPESTGNWSTWSGFQYSDKGRVSGIEGAVDLDYFQESILIDKIPAPPAAEPDGTYVVKKGDTLSQIALDYHTNYFCLAKKNAIANPNLIYPNEVLQVPDLEQLFVYPIKKGDTLWSLSIRFSTSIDEIAQLNCIDNPNRILMGTTLLIPKNK